MDEPERRARARRRFRRWLRLQSSFAVITIGVCLINLIVEPHPLLSLSFGLIALTQVGTVIHGTVRYRRTGNFPPPFVENE